MALYEKMSQMDIIEPALQLLSGTGGFRIHADGKIRALLEPSMFEEGPWLNVKIAPDRNCFLWHQIYFNYYRIVHSKCFNCWKIVIKPRNLEELMKLAKLEIELGFASKCGIERRDYATYKGWYAGFFYCPMTGILADARDFCEQIKVEVYKKLPLETPIILKRGCTEFENVLGPSNEWVYPEIQEGFEAMLDATWEVPPVIYPEPTVLIPFLFKRWIRWALTHGDPTASKYYDKLEHMGIVPTVRYDQGRVIPLCVPSIIREEKDNARYSTTKEEIQLEGLPED